MYQQNLAYANVRGVSANDADRGILRHLQFLQKLKLLRKGYYEPIAIMTQPPLAVDFLEMGSLAVADMVASTTYDLLNFQIPDGVYGVLKNRGVWFNGAGFVEGSGTLTFSFSNGDGWLYRQGNILYTIGPDNDTQLTGDGGGVLLRPNTHIRVQVTTAADISPLDAAGVVIAQLKGWYVPVAPEAA